MKSLDSNVEKKNLEGTYKKDSSEPSLTSWDLTEQVRKRDAERKSSEILASFFGGRFGGYSGTIGLPTMPSPKFTSTDIGKATINTPTPDKMEAQKVANELEATRESSKDELDK